MYPFITKVTFLTLKNKKLKARITSNCLYILKFSRKVLKKVALKIIYKTYITTNLLYVLDNITLSFLNKKIKKRTPNNMFGIATDIGNDNNNTEKTISNKLSIFFTINS